MADGYAADGSTASGRFVAKHYRTGEPMEFEVAGGRWRSCRTLPETGDGGSRLPWVAPALVDVQVNGFGGADFNTPLSDAGWGRACAALHRAGCAAFLATVITREPSGYSDFLAGQLEVVRRAPGGCRGLHLEGPFLNPSEGTRGAHDPACMVPCTGAGLDKLRGAIGDDVRMITLAPETGGVEAPAVIRALVERGIVIAVGHSAAMGDTLAEAVAAGAKCWTHLGNATARSQDKFDNVFFHALAQRDFHASMIPDGVHLPPHVFRALSGAVRGSFLVLTTDAMSAAGAEDPDGTYTLGAVTAVIGEDRMPRLPGSGRLAGSSLRPWDGVWQAAEMSGRPWADMWDAFSVWPARMMGWRWGLEIGAEASYCLFHRDPSPSLIETRLAGETVYSAES